MSWQMRAVGLLKRATSKRLFSRESGAQQLLTRPKGDPAPPQSMLRQTVTTREEVDGFEVVTVRHPSTAATGRPVVVYLHGGAYVNEVVSWHWHFVGQLACLLDVEVQVPLYGLAPQHDAAEARALVATLLRRLREQGRPCWLVGDSAGASLALLAAQQQLDEPGSTLRGQTLMAPWLDLSMSNPELDEAERRDPWLARAALREVARVWAAGTPLDDPSVSPLFGRVEGLPPTHVLVGTRDLTQPDCRLLVDRLHDAGVETTYDEEPGAVHVYPLLPAPEGSRARNRIQDQIRRGLGVGLVPALQEAAAAYGRPVTHLSVSRSRTYPVAVDRAFESVIGVPLEQVFDRRYLLIAPVRGTRDQDGPWGTPGQTRTVVLGDGSTMREELVAVSPGEHFDYRLDGVTGPLRPLISEVAGRWAFEPVGQGGTRVTWSWDITLRGPQGRVVAPVLRPLWQGFARLGLERLEGLLVGRA